MQQIKFFFRGFRFALTCIIFYLGAIFFSAIICISKMLIPSDLNRKRFLHRLLGFLLHVFRFTLRVINNIKVHIENPHLALSKSQIIIANHPSMIDALLIASVFPEVICVYKKSLRKVPFFSSILNQLEYISNDESSFIESSLTALHTGHSLLIFPEGTRSSQKKLLPFNRSAAALACRSGCSLLPVVIKSSEPFINKDSNWLKLPSKIDIILELCYPISPSEAPQCPDRRENEKMLTARLEGFFTSRLNNFLANERHVY